MLTSGNTSQRRGLPRGLDSAQSAHKLLTASLSQNACSIHYRLTDVLDPSPSSTPIRATTKWSSGWPIPPISTTRPLTFVTAYPYTAYRCTNGRGTVLHVRKDRPLPYRQTGKSRPPGRVRCCLSLSCFASFVRNGYFFSMYPSPLGTRRTALLSDELEPRPFHVLFSGLIVAIALELPLPKSTTFLRGIRLPRVLP